MTMSIAGPSYKLIVGHTVRDPFHQGPARPGPGQNTSYFNRVAMDSFGDSNDHSQSDYHRHTKQVYHPEIDMSDIDEKKLMRKVDWHVIPWLALLYLLSYLDRGNVGNARVRNSLIFLIRLMS